jgi:hypothetical protein
MPLRLYRGDSYPWQVRVWADEAHTAPTDLAGATAAAQIAGPGGVMVIDCSITLPNLIDMTLAATAWDGTTAYDRWDLQLTWDDGRVYTLLAGPVAVQDDVTP